MTIAVIVLSVVLTGIVSNLIALGVFFAVICKESESDDKLIGQTILVSLVPYLCFMYLFILFIYKEIEFYKKRDKKFEREYKTKRKRDKKEARLMRKQFKAAKRLENRG